MNWVYVVFGVFGVLMGFNFWLLFRNRRVGRFRLALIDQISEAAQADIRNGKGSWHWRYATLAQVSYEKTLYQFWKPLRPDAWWEDLAFLSAQDTHEKTKDPTRKT